MGPRDRQTAPLLGRVARRGHSRRAILGGAITILALSLSPAAASACSNSVRPPIASVSSTEVLAGTTLEFTIDTNCERSYYEIYYGSASYEEHRESSLLLPLEPEYQTFSHLITGLEPGKTYMYRLGVDDSIQFETREGTFTTPVLPAVEISPESQEASGAVRLSGSVDTGGGETRYSFEYGPSTEYGSKVVQTVPAAKEALPVEAEIKASLLLPGREYDFRLIAENSAGRVESANGTFIAPQIEEPPLASTLRPTETSHGAFMLQGEIDPGGLPSSYRFELGKTAAYGTDLPATEATIPAGEAPGMSDFGVRRKLGQSATVIDFCRIAIRTSIFWSCGRG